MSDKKSLLTESEIRRFMKLANIPSVGTLKEEREGANQIPEDPRRPAMGSPQEESYGAMEEMGGGMYEEDPMADEAPEADDEMVDVSDVAGGEGGAEPSGTDVAAAIVDALAGLGLVEKDEEGEVGAAPEEMSDSEEEEEEAPAEEEEEEEAPAEEEEEEEEEETESQMNESKFVDMVLSRVTARLIAEAKKKKEPKKKMTAAEKMKAMKAEKDKKKKTLEEANAAAPKSTTSNASKAGVAKGAGKADKGTWGVSKPRKDDKWQAGKGAKGDEMETVSASSEHMVSHGKKNLATQGGNKSK